MNVLGALVITAGQQRTLTDGSALDIPRASFRPKILREAMIGDLIWIKEPFVEIRSMQGCPKQIHEMVPGASPLSTAIPDHVKPYLHKCRMSPCQASGMCKSDSRATLEIMGICEHAIRCLVHLKPVADIVKARRAKG